MELHGIGFDRKTLEKQVLKIRKRLQELEEKARQVLGKPLDMKSSHKVATVLFEELKLPKLTGGMVNTQPSSYQGKHHHLFFYVLDTNIHFPCVLTFPILLPSSFCAGQGCSGPAWAQHWGAGPGSTLAAEESSPIT